MAAEHHTDMIITAVTFEDYWERYAAQGYEWVGEGMVKMPPLYEGHQLLDFYFIQYFTTYFTYRPVGVLRADPFSMRFQYDGKERSRQPDFQIILNRSLDRLTKTAMLGAADIVIEIVSVGTGEIDYNDKFLEYEQIGVQEYWIIEPRMKRADFYQLDDHGIYRREVADKDGNYRTPLLPDLAFHVPTLWADPLPTNVDIVGMFHRQFGG